MPSTRWSGQTSPPSASQLPISRRSSACPESSKSTFGASPVKVTELGGRRRSEPSTATSLNGRRSRRPAAQAVDRGRRSRHNAGRHPDRSLVSSPGPLWLSASRLTLLAALLAAGWATFGSFALGTDSSTFELLLAAFPPA